MPKQGEITYLQKIGPAGVAHALNKPFSDAECGRFLMEIGQVMTLLPPPPARLLDLGCGTGWTSWFLARRGYDVVGQDIAPDMIEQANFNKARYQITNLRFQVSDYEQMAFSEEFDCALFYDALHHAECEYGALRAVYEALKPGGVCLTLEPGHGHSLTFHSRHAMDIYGVTEKDMPSSRIIRAAKKAGFRRFQKHGRLSYLQRTSAGKTGALMTLLRHYYGHLKMIFCHSGIVVMTK